MPTPSETTPSEPTPSEPTLGTRAVAVILVVRSGGFAGLSASWRLEDGDPDEWRPMVDECPWDAPGGDPDARDRFTWRIEATLPEERREAVVPDAALVGPWRTLVDRVQAATGPGAPAGSTTPAEPDTEPCDE